MARVQSKACFPSRHVIQFANLVEDLSPFRLVFLSIAPPYPTIVDEMSKAIHTTYLVFLSRILLLLMEMLKTMRGYQNSSPDHRGRRHISFDTRAQALDKFTVKKVNSPRKDMGGAGWDTR